MLIHGGQPTDELQTVSRNISILKLKMDTATAKRRRFISTTSAGSTTTQMTNLSDDSSQATSPTDNFQSQLSNQPVFRLGSQDDGQPSGVSNGIPTCNRSNRTAYDKSLEVRRMQIKAKRANVARRQSESTVADLARSSGVPHRSHTTTCMRSGSMQEQLDGTFTKQPFNINFSDGSTPNVGGSNAQCNEPIYTHADYDCRLEQLPKQRAKSVDGLESLRVGGNFYDLPGLPTKRDTEIYIGTDRPSDRPGVRLSRKRLNSSMSETPPEVINEPGAYNDTDSGYIRALNGHAGFCETFSLCLKRHSLTILIACNVLLLFVNFVGLPYLAFVNLQRKGEVPVVEPIPVNCFRCWDMPYLMKKECLERDMLSEDGDRCCFKSSYDMNSWIIKQITADDPKGRFIYLTGNDVYDFESKKRIRWNDDKKGPMQITDKRTAIKVDDKGFYFIFSRVHFHSECTDSQSLSHTINRAPMGNSSHEILAENVSKCQTSDNVIEHTSVLETIAFLNDGEHVYVGIQNVAMVQLTKDHTVGLIKIK